MSGVSDGFMRHVGACNNAELPGRRLAFRIGGARVGYVLPEVAATLARFPEIEVWPFWLDLREPAALPRIVRALAASGLCRGRGEAFDVRPDAGGPPVAEVDRGALPLFGIMAEGVHVNGLVRQPDGLHIWIARRSAARPLDPGKLDHIVAGGMGAGYDPMSTLIKEAAEEAAIPAELACQASYHGVIGYAMERPEGLRRDRLHCFDLDLPSDFVPSASDGEAEGFELWPIERALAAVRETEDFKFNVNLVLIDLFIREGLIGGEQAVALRRALRQGGAC